MATTSINLIESKEVEEERVMDVEVVVEVADPKRCRLTLRVPEGVTVAVVSSSSTLSSPSTRFRIQSSISEVIRNENGSLNEEIQQHQHQEDVLVEEKQSDFDETATQSQKKTTEDVSMEEEKTPLATDDDDNNKSCEETEEEKADDDDNKSSEEDKVDDGDAPLATADQEEKSNEEMVSSEEEKEKKNGKYKRRYRTRMNYSDIYSYLDNDLDDEQKKKHSRKVSEKTKTDEEEQEKTSKRRVRKKTETDGEGQGQGTSSSKRCRGGSSSGRTPKYYARHPLSMKMEMQFWLSRTCAISVNGMIREELFGARNALKSVTVYLA